MSEIEFTFKGDPALLVQMLSGLKVTRVNPGVGASPVPGAPMPVTAQQPPPSPPRLTPPTQPYLRTEAPTQAQTQAPTMEPLHVDPVYDQQDGSSNLAPTSYPPENPEVAQSDFDFGQLELKPEAWEAFKTFVLAWLPGFDSPLDEEGKPTEEQPDRLQLLKDLGSGRWAIYIMRWCGHHGSLQGAVFQAFLEAEEVDGASESNIDLVDRVSANIIQVAHAAFPDIIGFHDHSTKWRRELAS